MTDETMGDYLGDDYLGEDYLGDDLGAEDVIGQRWTMAQRRAAALAASRRRRMRAGLPMPTARAPYVPARLGAPLLAPPSWREAQAAPGVQAPIEGMLVAGFRPEYSPTTITVPGTYVMTCIPQRPFRGERLVLDVSRTAGAAGVAVSVSSLRVGVDEQLVSGQPVAAAAFSSTAYDTRLSLIAAQPGILIQLTLLVEGAIPPGDSVQAVAALIGRAVTS